MIEIGKLSILVMLSAYQHIADGRTGKITFPEALILHKYIMDKIKY